MRDRLSRANWASLRSRRRIASISIRRYLDSSVLPAKAEVPRRTLFRWLDQYRKAEAAYGNGFFGLLPRSSERGNRAANFPKPLVA